MRHKITGRKLSRTKLEKGSKVIISFKVNKTDFNEMLSVVKKYLVPQNIDFYVNSDNQVLTCYFVILNY